MKLPTIGLSFFLAIQAAADSRPPVPIQLSYSGLETYLQNKKVALFGEQHTVDSDGQTLNDLRDDMRFRRLIPALKSLGYTHVALEIEYQHESTVRRGMERVSETRFGITGATIAPLARSHGLEVVCIDNRDKDRSLLRDEYMENRIVSIVQNNGRVAYFVGAAHLSLVDHLPPIAEVELSLTDDKMAGVIYQKLTLEGAKPLGKRLTERYGKDNVALVNLYGCTDLTVPACFVHN